MNIKATAAAQLLMRDHPGIKITVEQVDKTTADRWLNHNTSNRALRDGVAEAYARDMTTGNWGLCDAPIIFYDDDEMANGQHRCFAISESDTVQTFIVIRGWPRTAALNIDRGIPRTVVDNARITGLAIRDHPVSTQLVATARAIEIGARFKARLTDSELLALTKKHADAALWTLAHAPRGKYVRSTAVTGAIARAWYAEEDKERLARFGALLTSGLSEGRGDAAAIAIRNYLIARGQEATQTKLWIDTFWKVQNALGYFMRGTPLSIIRQVSYETYPLGATKIIPSRYRDQGLEPKPKLGMDVKPETIKARGRASQSANRRRTKRASNARHAMGD
jgi:hypothetical protein